MSRAKGWGPLSLIVGVLLTVGFVADADAQARFSGRATVLEAHAAGLLDLVLVDTGELPASGGSLEQTLLEANVPGVLTAEVLHATTVGAKKASHSEASVANLDLTVAGHHIAAGLLMARATAVCEGTVASVTGDANVVTLTIDGQTITVSGAPNQTVDLAGVHIVINEQQSSVSGGTGDITVNALHVTITGLTGEPLADVVVSAAHADITCGGVGPAGDCVTGGGWSTGTPSGAPANCGVAGGLRNIGLWGHLTYIDHGGKLKVKGTAITAYSVTGPTSRRIEGTAEVNGQAGFTFTVDVADNGEPGDHDTFTLTLSNGYTAGGHLVGGNIQLHP